MCETVVLLIHNLRTHENIRNPTKKPQECGFVIFGRTYCAIHELIRYAICCSLGKKLRCFYRFHVTINHER